MLDDASKVERGDPKEEKETESQGFSRRDNGYKYLCPAFAGSAVGKRERGGMGQEEGEGGGSGKQQERQHPQGWRKFHACSEGSGQGLGGGRSPRYVVEKQVEKSLGSVITFHLETHRQRRQVLTRGDI